jgi:HK97 family phage major capsid protein
LQAFAPWLAQISVLDAPQGGGLIVPVGASGVTTSWQSAEGASTTESTLTLSTLSASVHTVSCYTRLSRQLLKQTGGQVFDIVKLEFTRGVATAVAKAILQGSSTAGQPAGLLNSGNLTTASGASVAFSNLVTAMTTVAGADGVMREENLAWITTPTVAGVLKQRYRVSGTSAEAPLWNGAIPHGDIEDLDAFATTACPSGSLLFGDLSAVNLVGFPGSALLEVDPFSGFQTGLYGCRLTIYCDVSVSHWASLYGLTGVT